MSANVLIAMGTSYLENAVSAIVKDSLSARGYDVTIIDIKTLNARERRDYRAIILFNAVKAEELGRVAKKFVRSIEGSKVESSMLICDIYGEKWNGKEQDVGAVASATKTVKPEAVASKIISQFNLIVNKE